jgi:hypothetical protein
MRIRKSFLIWVLFIIINYSLIICNQIFFCFLFLIIAILLILYNFSQVISFSCILLNIFFAVLFLFFELCNFFTHIIF